MSDITLQYVFNVIKAEDSGTLGAIGDPDPPSDLGTALTQDQIDILKTFINEIQNRFGGGGS